LKFDILTVAVLGTAATADAAGDAVATNVEAAGEAEAAGELLAASGDPLGVGVFVPPSLEHEEFTRSITTVNVKPRTFSIIFSSSVSISCE
jgi:hypothetical protein